MLDVERLQSGLPIHGLGSPLYTFDVIGSTNDEAARLAAQGARHGTLIVADEQTAGRGRQGRRWVTPPGAAIAMSVILRPEKLQPHQALALNVAGALAVAEATGELGCETLIKWPNDVLLAGRKVAGVLAEGVWLGERPDHVVIGIGINIKTGSAPPDDQVDFPATCLEAGGLNVDRIELILRVLDRLGARLEQPDTPRLIEAWERRLAFRQQLIELETARGRLQGILLGLTAGGELRLQQPGGAITIIGETARLRPVDRQGG
jgi:BirA family transcriptional regulator, biotin operon repressor / biotin---[acetyl-CoA-carboxylase] ligase